MADAASTLVETYRGMVVPGECDVMGHLTIACYCDRFVDAAFSLIERLAPAAAPPAAAWRSTSLFMRYEKELGAGDGIAIRSGVVGREGDEIRLGHELVESATPALATRVEHTLAPRDLPYGALAEQRRQLAAAVVPWTTPGFEPIPPLAHPERMLESGRDRAKAWEVDERGELSLSGMVSRFTGGCLQLCAAMGLTPDYMRREHRGFSTFETRLHIAAPPPGAGDALLLRSGLLAIGNSSVRMLHELTLARSGESVALFYQSGVHFDLEARRSAPLPAELRRRAGELVIGQ
jgi:acyl-CoA thioester hydrolase